MWGTTKTLTDDSLVTQHFFLRIIKNKRKRKKNFPIYIELNVSKSSIGFLVSKMVIKEMITYFTRQKIALTTSCQRIFNQRLL